jgi:hypothetical protein
VSQASRKKSLIFCLPTLALGMSYLKLIFAVRSYFKPHRSSQYLKGVSHDRLGSLPTSTRSNTRDAIYEFIINVALVKGVW